MERAVDGRIKTEIQSANGLVHDGPDLDGPGIRRIDRPLIPNFNRQADADGPIPRFRNSHPGPDMVADPLPAHPGIRTGEDVETQLEPIVEAVRDFERLVQLVLRRVHTVDDGLTAFEGKVAVKLEHGGARIN